MLNLTSYYVCTSVTKGGISRSEVFNDFVEEQSPRYWTGCVMYRIETDNEEDLGQGWHVTLKHPQSSNDFITRRIKKRREPRGSNVEDMEDHIRTGRLFTFFVYYESMKRKLI